MELSKLISAALAKSDDSTKVASLRDVSLEDQTFQRVDDYLMGALDQRPPEEAQKRASAPVVEPPGGMDIVRRAIKLAAALEAGAMVVEKLADAQGPAGPVTVQPMPFANARTQKPKPQASAHARALDWGNRPVHGGKPETDEGKRIDGPVIIPDNYPTSRTPAGTSQKHASSREEMRRLLNQKVAEHRVFVSLGQTEAAAEALQKAAEIENQLKTNDALGTHFPDNEGVRNLTKAQARDANQREAGAFFGEPVKRDNAVAAHALRTDGLKLSAKKKEERSTGGTGAALGGGLFGGLGAAVGAGFTGDKHNSGRRAAGAGVGSIVGGLGGDALGAAAGGRRGALFARHLGGAGGGYLGNKMVHDRTKHEKRAAEKKERSDGSKGTLIGSALGGPLGGAIGAGVSGPQHNRGRRALGAGAGGLAGQVGGDLVGSRAGRALARAAGKSPTGQALGHALGGTLVGRAGAAAGAYQGNKIVNNKTKKASDVLRKLAEEKRSSDGTGGTGGSAIGNKAVGAVTKKAARGLVSHAVDEEHPALKAASKKDRERERRSFAESGSHGAASGAVLGHLFGGGRGGGALGGAAGAAVSGPSHNRGRRALGAGVGSLGGSELGRASGQLAAGGAAALLHGRGATAARAARMGGAVGDYLGGTYGASYGNRGVDAISKKKEASIVPMAGNLLANVGQRVAQYGARAIGAAKRMAQPAVAAGGKTPGTGLVLRGGATPQHGLAQGLSRKTHQMIGGAALGSGALVAGSGVNAALGGGR